MIFYFTGTGNSRWAATETARLQNEKLIFIPDAIDKEQYTYTLGEEEKIGFVFPVYSWAPPGIVREFIEKLELNGYTRQYLFFISVCGDDTGLTRNIFCKHIRRKNWKCQAGFSLTMPNNYILIKGFDTDSPRIEKQKLSESVPYLQEINRAVREKEHVFRCKKGSFPFIKTYLISPVFNRGITAKPFHTDGRCIACKRCEHTCPVHNITVTDKPIWGKKCTSCLACIHVCPVKTIQYGKQTQHKGRYLHPGFGK